jgi:hypothetical protein
MPQKYRPRIDERWIRHDWRLWIRPDIARWMKPGVDPADVIPALARERAQKEAAKERARAAEDAAFEAAIEHARRVQAALRAEVDELKAARARQRLEEAKYSPDQPRVPAGNTRGGQWTDRSGGQSTVAGPASDIGQSQDADPTHPMGNVATGDVTGLSELDGSPNIREGEFDMAARGNEAECDLQYKRDKLICNLVRTPLCWAQAAERYAACLSGRPIPMLRF